MGARKKRFECGHYGYGKYCHLCQSRKKKREARKMEKEAKTMYVRSNGNYVSNVPLEVQRKAVEQFIRLNTERQVYSNIHAKRMVTMGQRNVVSLEVGRSFRLICWQAEGKFKWVELLSHEAYSSKLKRGGWA